MIILASGSPRRKEILDKHSVHPVIIKPETDENVPSVISDSLTAEQTVMYLALKKGMWVWENISSDNKSICDFVISADTVVYDGTIIGKPQSKQEAFDILHSLKGKPHKVMTGVWIKNCKIDNSEIFCDTSTVYFKNYSDADIYKYIDEENPFDKAGAYAIQGIWGKNVNHIDGDMENVIGLPWHRIEPIIASTALSN